MLDKRTVATALAGLLASAACNAPHNDSSGDSMLPTPKRPVIDSYHGVAVRDD